MDAFERCYARRLYEAGLNSRQIGPRFGVSETTIWRMLHQEGVAMRPPGCLPAVNEAAFDEWTPEALYWAGFIAADGNIRQIQSAILLRVELAERDREHVEKLHAFLGSGRPLRTTASSPSVIRGREIKACRGTQLTVSSTHIGRRLAELGLVPGKNPARVFCEPARSSADFWRGVIDGDGMVRQRSDWKGPQASLCGSMVMIEQLATFVRALRPKSCFCPQSVSGAFALHYYGETAYTIIETLYYAGAVALTRKAVSARRLLIIYRRRYRGEQP